MVELKKSKGEKENGICGGVGAANTPTYTPISPLAGIISVDSYMSLKQIPAVGVL